MSLSMSAALQSACRSASSEPVVTVTIADQPCERPHFNFAAIYNDSTADQPHAACVASDGSICRIRTSASGGDVFVQRVTSPTTPSQWTTWTDTGQDAWNVAGDGLPPRVDIAAGPTSGHVYAVYGKYGGATDRGQVWWARSTDNGASWSAWALLVDLGNSTYVRGLALCPNASNMHCFVAFNPGGGVDQDNAIRALYYDGTAWQALTNYLYNRWPIDGIDACWHTSAQLFQVLVADGDPRQLSYHEFRQSDWTWSLSDTIFVTGTAAATAPYEPRWWRVPQVNFGRYGYAWIERSTSPSYNRAGLCLSPVKNWVTEEVGWEWTCNYGLDVCYNPVDGYWYFVQVNRAQRALAYTGAAGEIATIADSRIVALRHEQDVEQPGELTLVVDNSDGAFNTLAGDYACVRVGAQLSLKWGYTTGAGVEQLVQTPLWITHIGYQVVAERGESYLVVRARDCWGELARLANRRQLAFTNRSLAYIVQRCWWRVLKRAESDPIAAMALVLPGYQIPPGKRWDEVLRALARSVGCVVRFRSNQTTPTGWTAVEVEVIGWTAGASCWSWGAAGLDELGEVQYWLHEQPYHGVCCQAQGYWGQYHDWVGTRDQFRDVPVFIEDRTLDTQAEADSRAASEWSWRVSPQVQARIEVWPVPGLEPGDCVTLTDSRFGIVGAKRAIRHITTSLDRRVGAGAANRERAHFRQRYELEYSA